MAQAETPHPLVAALWQLYDTVSARPDQTVFRLAEQSVLAWTGFLEGKGLIQPRMGPSGYAPAGFHLGLEADPDSQLDAVKLDGDLETYLKLLAQRQERLKAALDKFSRHTGYRNSTDQCDHLMVELSHFSRFLAACCVQVERTHGALARGEEPQIDLFAGTGRGSLLFEVRFQMFYWEPFLNDTIVAWQQNSLPDYLHTLHTLKGLLALPESHRRTIPHQSGFPWRAQGRARIKTIIILPEGRPLRGQSMFELRIVQLVRRIEAHPNLPPRSLADLEREVQHCIRMTEAGIHSVATEPSFQNVGRQALSLIRSKPTVHPFLADPVEFFKKAVLFFNGTYTIAGGGLDPMYLQMRQLERYYRFDQWAAAREVRGPLEASLIAWEENRWRGFTAGVLRVAEVMRGDAAA